MDSTKSDLFNDPNLNGYISKLLKKNNLLQGTERFYIKQYLNDLCLVETVTRKCICIQYTKTEPTEVENPMYNIKMENTKNKYKNIPKTIKIPLKLVFYGSTFKEQVVLPNDEIKISNFLKNKNVVAFDVPLFFELFFYIKIKRNNTFEYYLLSKNSLTSDDKVFRSNQTHLTQIGKKIFPSAMDADKVRESMKNGIKNTKQNSFIFLYTTPREKTDNEEVELLATFRHNNLCQSDSEDKFPKTFTKSRQLSTVDNISVTQSVKYTTAKNLRCILLFDPVSNIFMKVIDDDILYIKNLIGKNTDCNRRFIELYFENDKDNLQEFVDLFPTQQDYFNVLKRKLERIVHYYSKITLERKVYCWSVQDKNEIKINKYYEKYTYENICATTILSNFEKEPKEVINSMVAFSKNKHDYTFQANENFVNYVYTKVKDWIYDSFYEASAPYRFKHSNFMNHSLQQQPQIYGITENNYLENEKVFKQYIIDFENEQK